jgi:hypothetical protein
MLIVCSKLFIVSKTAAEYAVPVLIAEVERAESIYCIGVLLNYPACLNNFNSNA